jgi:hypothetical protein
MTTAPLASSALATASYAALRHGGAPAARARQQLGLDRDLGVRLERSFLARRTFAGDAMRPRYARHAEHVRQVLEAGGYPVLPDKRR